MRITFETKDDIAILKISGRMIFDETLFLLRSYVRNALQSGVLRFVIDISDVPYLDSSGCGEMISTYISIAKANGSMALLNPAERVRILLTRIRLTEILKIFDTLDEAQEFVRL